MKKKKKKERVYIIRASLPIRKQIIIALTAGYNACEKEGKLLGYRWEGP